MWGKGVARPRQGVAEERAKGAEPPPLSWKNLAATAPRPRPSAQHPHSPRPQSHLSPSLSLSLSPSHPLHPNSAWAAATAAADPAFFPSLASGQTPQYLWIGCADSRVPANEILGLAPGDVFVQRNVGNLAIPRDMNAMACLEYAVDVLAVRHVIVCGHYGCGAVKAALTLPSTTGGFVSHWVSDIRATRDRHAAALRRLPGGPDARWQRLVELNVVHQVFNVVVAPIVQAAWARGQPLAVHGLVYSLTDGLLQEVTHPIACAEDVDAAAADAEAAARAGDVGHALLGEAFSTHRWFQDTSTAAAEAEVAAAAAAKVEAAEAETAEEAAAAYRGAAGG